MNKMRHKGDFASSMMPLLSTHPAEMNTEMRLWIIPALKDYARHSRSSGSIQRNTLR